jgi:glycosyltransferase involved in cell wall biosynthesis
MDNNHFVFIAPMYNASSTLQALLHSLFGQSYQNWKIVLIDDVSLPEEAMRCNSIIEKFKSFLDKKDKIIVKWNSQKQWEMFNVLEGIYNHTIDSDIVCRIDADDVLCDLDALLIMNQAYKETECEIAWSMHRWGYTDYNISGELKNDEDPYKVSWRTSHLKSFSRKLMNGIPFKNFLNMNDEFVKRAGDQALYLPLLHRSKKRFFVPRVLYRYSIKTDDKSIFHTDDAKFQKAEAEFLRSRGYVDSGESWEYYLSR